MESRGSNVNTLDYDMTLNFREGKYYLSLEIVIRTIINKLLNGCSFRIAYYAALLQIIQPKVLITFYSRNSMGLLSKYYKAEYYSIQNGFHLPGDISKSEANYTHNLFCFGKYDIDLYKQPLNHAAQHGVILNKCCTQHLEQVG